MTQYTTFVQDECELNDGEAFVKLVEIKQDEKEYLTLTKYKDTGLWLYYKGDPVWASDANKWLPAPKNFEEALAHAINHWSQENGSNTPDFILASYLKRCLETFNDTMQARNNWYGRSDEPGKIENSELKPVDEATLKLKKIYETYSNKYPYSRYVHRTEFDVRYLWFKDPNPIRIKFYFELLEENLITKEALSWIVKNATHDYMISSEPSLYLFSVDYINEIFRKEYADNE